MPSPLFRQPWQTWVVIALGLWSAYLLYASALSLRIFFRADIITNQEQFAEALLRLAGLVLFVLGAFALSLKRRLALLLVGMGFLLYLAPWAYRYYQVSATQQQPHLVWHMIKMYPKFTWEWLPLPIGMLLFNVLAVRRLSTNTTVESDAQQAARGSP